MFNTDGWVKALQFYQDLYTKYGVSQVGTTDDEVKALFYSGKCLFYLANTIRATEADFDIAGIYHPYFEGGEIAVPHRQLVPGNQQGHRTTWNCLWTS